MFACLRRGGFMLMFICAIWLGLADRSSAHAAHHQNAAQPHPIHARLIDDVRASPQRHLGTTPPGNFPFQTATSSDGLIVLHYYYRGAGFSDGVFRSIQGSLSGVIHDHVGYSLTRKVDIYIYNSRSDFLVGAQPTVPDETYAYSSFYPPSIYLPITDLSDPLMSDTLAHELTHIVLDEHLNIGQLNLDYL